MQLKKWLLEKVAVAKEVFEDWNEQRKEAAEQRKAYNREKDTRFADAADQALDTLEKRGITTDRDNFETSAVIDNEPMVDTVTTVESPKAPTSWNGLDVSIYLLPSRSNIFFTIDFVSI